MKQYLVKFNHPLHIEDCPCEKTKSETIYGFLGPNKTDDEEQNVNLEDDIYSYVCYLSRVNNHNLDYDLFEIDLDGSDGVCLECGRDRSFITCDSLMDNLVRLAEQQAEEESKEQYTFILFNRPIWIPKHAFWPDQDGYCHIYGLVADHEIDEEFLKMCDTYLGYLAMCEEYTMAGQTPSGYTTKEGSYFYKDGEEYYVASQEIQAECLLCLNKHNLKCRAVVVRMTRDEMEEGVQDEFITCRWLYESLIEETGIANDNTWMSEIY